MLSESQQEKLLKLKKMRLIATGLLLLMLIIYIIFKRYESYNVVTSSIVAFSEASIIGALADWFAVVALFRHPLGMSWIPHTAIIQKNKDKIAESLSDFVVSNFFTADVIEHKLKNVSFSGAIIGYLKENKAVISRKTAIYLPGIVKIVLNSNNTNEFLHKDLRKKLENVKLYQLINTILPDVVSSRFYVPIVKKLLANCHEWVGENREKTMRILEGFNKTLTLPFVGDIVYKGIMSTMEKLVKDIENNESTEFNNEVLYNVPDKLVEDFRNSGKAEEKVDKLKADILNSETFNNFYNEKIVEITEKLMAYAESSSDELGSKLANFLEELSDDIFKDDSIRENADEIIRMVIVNISSGYKHEIARLIRDTVNNWPMEDMVEKLETQVGGDLQYIRINGTVIGGLAGLAIHIISFLFRG